MKYTKKYIEVGTSRYWDCWTAYKEIDFDSHQTKNHSYHFADPDDRTHTQTVECMRRKAKNKICWKSKTHAGKI